MSGTTPVVSRKKKGITGVLVAGLTRGGKRDRVENITTIFYSLLPGHTNPLLMCKLCANLSMNYFSFLFFLEVDTNASNSFF